MYKKRRQNAAYYIDNLKEEEKITFPEFNNNNSYFLFQVILSDSINRDDILQGLKSSDIGFSIHYATPVPLMSYYKDKYKYARSDFPNAVKYADKSISLPVHPNLSKDDISYVCNTLINLLRK